MSEAPPLLALSGVNTHIGPYHILQGVDLMVPRGKLTMLLGRNGAGKTTTLRTIMGLWHASAGAVTFDGTDITAWATPDIARAGIGYVPETMGIFADLTVRENLLLGARRSGRADDWTVDRVFELFPRLRERAGQAGGTLSGGEQQMLALGRALLTNGRVLLLDEPSEGLAPQIVHEIGRILGRLKAERLSILLVEQNYHLALAIADRVYVMSKGQIVWEGTPAALESSEDVRHRYLGVA